MQSNYKDELNKTGAAASELKEKTCNTLNEVKDDLYDMANQAGRKVRNVLNSAKDDVTEATDTVTTSIRKKPVQSALIALGAGYVLASLLRRR